MNEPDCSTPRWMNDVYAIGGGGASPGARRHAAGCIHGCSGSAGTSSKSTIFPLIVTDSPLSSLSVSSRVTALPSLARSSSAIVMQEVC